MKLRNNNIFRIAIHLCTMLGIVIVSLVIVFSWIKSYTRHGEYVSVPSVIGKTAVEASDILSKKGLRYEIADYRYDADFADGTVIEQNPECSSFVKEERVIYLTLNSGKEPMKVIPDVADNSSLRGAESRLKSAGFKLTEPIYQAGDKDWVYEVLYKGQPTIAGISVPEGSTLTIVVGNGDPIENTAQTDSTVAVESDFFGE